MNNNPIYAKTENKKDSVFSNPFFFSFLFNIIIITWGRQKSIFQEKDCVSLSVVVVIQDLDFL